MTSDALLQQRKASRMAFHLKKYYFSLRIKINYIAVFFLFSVIKH